MRKKELKGKCLLRWITKNIRYLFILSFLKKSKKFIKKQKCSNEILTKIIFVGIYIYKENVGNFRTIGKSVQSSTKKIKQTVANSPDYFNLN